MKNSGKFNHQKGMKEHINKSLKTINDENVKNHIQQRIQNADIEELSCLISEVTYQSNRNRPDLISIAEKNGLNESQIIEMINNLSEKDISSLEGENGEKYVEKIIEKYIIHECIHNFKIYSIYVQFNKKKSFLKQDIIYNLSTYFLYKCDICGKLGNGNLGKKALYNALSINDDKQFLNWVYRNFEKGNIKGNNKKTYISFDISNWIFNNEGVF